MSAAASEAAPLRFSGENEDGREYKRWKTWVKNKLLTLDKLPETARGAYIYTLLAGKALEAVEHLDPGDYQKKDGDQVLWSLLDKRFPQLEVVDELGEILGEVFNLRSQEGETMKQWAARASELFDRCHRKTGVQFPDEARGWLLLHRANLSEEQKAVVISRARGDLKRESIAAALRSCYPDLVVGKRRTAVALAEETMDDPTEPHDAWEEDFSDVERLLEDHQSSADWAADTEAYNEAEAAGEWTPDEVMLVSSPGFGVLDSGCGRTVVGASTLQSFEKLWSQRGWTVPSKISEVHQFKFGNGDVETSHYSVQMPVILANRRGVIRAAVIKGDAPLLVSRSALKSLGASLDFQKDCLNVFGQSVPLKTNGAGQYVVDLLSPKDTLAADFTEVMTLEPHPHPANRSPEAPEADTPLTLEPSASPAADEKYGLQLPESDRYIRKSTRLLVSHEDMSSLGLTCDQTGTHQCHDVIAGSAPGVPRISTFAGAYPVKFVQAVLNTIPQFQLDRSKATSSCECIAHVEVINEEVPDASWTEILAAGQELLTKVKEEGSVHLLLNALMEHETSEFEFVPSAGYSLDSGAMNDSSKRRLTADSSQAPHVHSQRPIVKMSSQDQGSIPLPKGITSMDHWGKTLITSGKLSKQNLSYEDLASSPETDLVNYSRWLMAQKDRTNMSPPIKDLIAYLLAYTELAEGSTERFPDSTIPRKFKS
ncbi:unnamed protein product [Durusdinium trenchii]|uniref:Uncharacterized protein n=1 Tax=Durusdinium trenchii TaxID=1381693 RepID=A0ABP0LMM8_9DINO